MQDKRALKINLIHSSKTLGALRDPERIAIKAFCIDNPCAILEKNKNTYFNVSLLLFEGHQHLLRPF